MALSKEEFIGIAAEAICQENMPGYQPSLEDLAVAVAQASAALDAVGAWDLLEACREARKWPEEDEFGNAIDEAYATPGYRAYRQQLRNVIAKVEGR